MLSPTHSITVRTGFICLVVAVLASGLVHATDWKALNRIAQKSTDQQAQAQQQIEKLDDEAQAAYAEYRSQLIQLESLRTYNRQLQVLRDQQQAKLDDLATRIQKTGQLDRQIVPLMERMLGALETFIQADMPFLLEERTARLEKLRTILDDPELSLATKYRSLYEAYQIELDYGHLMETYSDTLELDGQLLSVTVLRVGRVGLFAMTGDRKRTFVWNKRKNIWQPTEELGNYLQQAVRMAKKQAAPDLLVLPVESPRPASSPPAEEVVDTPAEEKTSS